MFEQRLRDSIAEIFPFQGYSVHFPRNHEALTASWLEEEKKLLLPLPDGQGGLLGLFMARGVPEQPAQELSPHWPVLGRIIAENLLLYKRSLCDPATGLFSRHYLLHCMERDIEKLRDTVRTASAASGTGTNPDAGALTRKTTWGTGEGLFSAEHEGAHRACMGTLVIRLAALRDVVREFGYRFADGLMLALADALTGMCPEQALAARTGDSEFAVHLPAAGNRTCRALAGEIAHALGKVCVLHPLRREHVSISASVGYTAYPQDMEGSLFIRPAAEQARLVLRKARLAAALANETTHPNRTDRDCVLGFGHILSEGGRVLESLPLSRVLVSLGAGVYAKEGQRFSVWSTHFASGNAHGKRFAEWPTATRVPMAPLYKGEIVLMEVYEDVSQAEIIHLGEPAWNMEPGDHLLLLPEEQGSLIRNREETPRLDPATNLLRHGDFLARWAEEHATTDAFALALIRLAPKLRNQEEDSFLADLTTPFAPHSGQTRLEKTEGTSFREGDGALPDLTSPQKTFPAQEPAVGTDPGHVETKLFSHPGSFMTEAVRLCLEELGLKILGGRYGLNSLIFYHPGADPEALRSSYERLAHELDSRLNLDAAIGIAPHPYLDFRKADALENCRKALEYAMLLPYPHVGLLDSLALNISADKRFSQGDSFGAIKEYQLALLADERNGMAWNSLGICLAGIGRHAEAERHFTKALECNPKDAMALYNLGYMHQSQGRTEEARLRYRECLSHEPNHLFAMVRMGQLAENAGNHNAARSFFENAAMLPGGESLTYRHFARLSISEGKLEEAREHLHEALLYDPQDALSMALLSRLYLDGGEDPEMAASLARQSVSLRPELKAGWLQLARALTALGKEDEAQEARFKAGGI
ncbi:MAG: tetratricopeptide repeat protein [Desulfovibrio sp.]|nr:tetratricopeptide repeat protein [Desulfovibrio sp.]